MIPADPDPARFVHPDEGGPDPLAEELVRLANDPRCIDGFDTLIMAATEIRRLRIVSDRFIRMASEGDVAERRLRAEVAAIEAEKADLLGALRSVVAIARQAHDHWDNDRDSKVGKSLSALAGWLPGYRADSDLIHDILARHPLEPTPEAPC